MIMRSGKMFFVVRMVVYGLKVIGVAPFSISMKMFAKMNPRNIPIRVFQSSKIGLVYNLLFLILVLGLGIQRLVHWFSMGDLEVPAISVAEKFVRSLNRILPCFTACLIIVLWGLKQKNAVGVMNRMLEVDVRLSSLKKHPSRKRALIFLIVYITANTCLRIIIWCLTFYNFEINAEFLYFIFSYNVQVSTAYWFMLEYFIVVSLIARDMQTVNNYLQEFKEFGNYLSLPPRMRVNGNSNSAVVDLSTQNDCQLASLELLLAVRTILRELCENITEFFSLPILFSIASCFVGLFYGIFNVTLYLDDHDDVVFLTSEMIMLYVYPIVSLAYSVTRTQNEAKRTGQIVHKILASATRVEIREALESFSLQLLHEDVNFTAYGIFSLNSTLLQSLLGGVATYSIILIQFEESVCKSNTTNIDL